jgi:DNA-binding response OmpR family regulator
LQALLKDTEYVPVHATDWNTALNLAGHIFFPVILYDRFFDITDWQLAVRRLVSSWRSPSVLLLSQTREDGLRDELIRTGGFDVLTRPLGAHNVLRKMDAAMARFASH